MNRPQFYKKLQSLIAKGWKAHVDKKNNIRLRKPSTKYYKYCPITAVCKEETGEYWSLMNVSNAALSIKLLWSTKFNSIEAADDGPKISQDERFKMLQSLGL